MYANISSDIMKPSLEEVENDWIVATMQAKMEKMLNGAMEIDKEVVRIIVIDTKNIGMSMYGMCENEDMNIIDFNIIIYIDERVRKR